MASNVLANRRSVMNLFTSPTCPYCHLTRIVLAEKDIIFEAIEVAARIHHCAVQIHPFKNGNGRWSRLLSNIWLKQNSQPLTMWPSIVGESPVRDEYLKAVKEADNLNFEPLLEMHRRYADSD